MRRGGESQENALLAALRRAGQSTRMDEPAKQPTFEVAGNRLTLLDTGPRRLQALAADLLGVSIQDGEHDPAEDARAALAVYKKVHAAWETDLRKARRA